MERPDSDWTKTFDFACKALNCLVAAHKALPTLRKLARVLRSGISQLFDGDRLRWAAGMAPRAFAIATALVALVLSIQGYWHQYSPKPDRHTVRTGPGQFQEIRIGHHTINVNENSALTYTDDRQNPLIKIQYGEIGVETAKDWSPPLRVITPDVTIRSDAGIFGARVAAEGGTEVVVSEEGRETTAACHSGWSLWSPFSSGATRKLTLYAGHSAQVQRCIFRLGRITDDAVPQISPHEELLFKDVRLAEALTDINAYYQRPIHIQDPSLAELKISGKFNPLDRKGLLRRLQREHAIEYKQAADGGVQLTGRTRLVATH